MSRLVPNHLCSFLLALGSVLVCSLPTAPVCAGQRGQPIQFSNPGEGVTFTNANQLRKKQLQDELLEQQLPKGLVGSLNLFRSKGSLSGMVAPPTRPAAVPSAQNMRIKELLERRKNWVFTTPDDLREGQTQEDLFKLRQYDRDGQARKGLSPIERYYESLDHGMAGGTNRLAERFVGGVDTRKEDDFSSPDNAAPLGNPLLQTEDKLRDLFDTDPRSASSRRANGGSIFSDFFGPSGTMHSQQASAQKARLVEFIQLLESRPPLTATMILPTSGRSRCRLANARKRTSRFEDPDMIA